MKSPPDPSQFRLPKKTPKADVSRNSSVYFAVGLVLMLFISYQSINYKSYDKTDIDIIKNGGVFTKSVSVKTKRISCGISMIQASIILSS